MSAAMHGQESRVIYYAMLASIVLHGLLFSFSTQEASRRAAAAPAPIVARLVEQPPAVPAQPEAVAPARVEQSKPPPSPKPRPVAKAAPKAPPAQPAAPEPAAPVPAAPTAQAQPAAPAPSAAPSPAPSAGELDAGALARYRIEVAGEAGKLKRYPRAAIDNNWAGRVVVAVTVRANGVPSYSVRVSSGYGILDQQALEMISKAQARAEVPAALRGREFSFEIPVDFDLKEASG